MATGTTSVANLNTADVATGYVLTASISADGRFVALSSLGALTADDDNTGVDVYVRDLILGQTTLATPNFPRDPTIVHHIFFNAMSRDGRFVAFTARNLAVPYELYDMYVRDLRHNRTILVSRNFQGTGGGDYSSHNASFSDDGTVLLFSSEARNLVPKCTFTNVYLFRLELGGLGSVDRNELPGY